MQYHPFFPCPQRPILALFVLLAILGLVLPAHATLDFKEVTAVSAAIEAIQLEGRNDFFLPPGTDGLLEAKTYPRDLKSKVRWEIVDQSGDLEIQLNPETGLLVVEPRSGMGWITVRASVDGCAPLDQRIDIDCECIGESGTCDSEAGAGKVLNGSVDVRLSLGMTGEGRSAGDLFLHAEEPLAILSTPEALVINSSREEVTPVYRDGLLEQIQTPQAIVNVIRYSPLKYEVHFYDRAFQGQKTDEGLYSVDLKAVAISVWRIENPDRTGQTVNELSVTEIRGGKAREFYYSYEAADNNWRLISGNGLKIESKAEFTRSDGDRVVRTEVAGPEGDPVRVVETAYRDFAFGEKLVCKTIDPDGADLATEYRYHTEPGPGRGKLAARIDPEGGWVRYFYDEKGRVAREERPFLDTPFDSPDGQAIEVIKSYTPVDKADLGAEKDRHRPRMVMQTTNGIETARTYYAYIREKDGSRAEISERCTRQAASYGHPANLRTVTTYYSSKEDGPQAGKIRSRQSEGGLLTTYTYEAGRFKFSPDPAKCRFIPGRGRAVRTTVTHGTPEHPGGIPFRTTREITITDAMGWEKLQETFVRTANGFERIDWCFYSRDRQGRVIETLQANHTRTESAWGCCGKTSATDVEGITTRYAYDDLKRLIARNNEATGVGTIYTYDAAGRMLTTTESKNDLSLTQKSDYDVAGRLVSQVNAAGLVTHYAVDGRVATTTRPGGATEITTRHLDGKIRSVNGTGVVHRFYRYGVNPDGSQWTQTFIGKADSPRWEKTTRDVAGRVIQVENPGFDGIEITRRCYDRYGRLIRVEKPGRGATLCTYDELGMRVRSGLDVDGDNKLTPASMDRISVVKALFKKTDNEWWQESTRSIYAHDNQDRETVVSIQRHRLTGWKDGVISERVAVDINGNATRSVVTLDRFNRIRTKTIHAPDSDTPSRTVHVDGRLASTTRKTGITMTYGYDALGRLVAVEDPRKGLSMLHYDKAGRLDWVQDAAGNRSRYEYDPDTGRKIAEYNALNKASRYQYNPRGQLIRTWGDVPYPVEYRYDIYGQMRLMRTFRNGTGWNGSNWPADTGRGDPTIWHYQASTGLLLAKEDAKGHRTCYAYGANGALKVRTWARLKDGRPLQTFYSYDHASGDLTAIDYSDETPDIAFTYDRLGRKIRVNDAAGVHYFTYNEKLQLVAEELIGKQNYQLERQYDNLGRSAGITLDDGYKVTYDYDNKGRFESVDWEIDNQDGDVAYRYLDRSDRLAGMESSSGLSVAYAYEPGRDLKTAVINTFKDRLISKYEYQYDRLGRRINVVNTGEAFETPGFWLYGYNDRNELTSANRFEGHDLQDQSRPLQKHERVYRYDPIGNRREVYEGKEKIVYQSNELNQYEKIEGLVPANELLIYDEDGNLKEDDRFHYIWNAENRLVAVESKGIEPIGNRVDFAYDYIGRRIKKEVFDQKGHKLKPRTPIRLIYDEWCLIKELNAGKEADKDSYHVWGLDISQSRQGAGGIGGLLSSILDGKIIKQFAYDGIGNVGSQLNFNGQLNARVMLFEPFGESIMGKKSPNFDEEFEYSTKRRVKESNIHYYGFRYYAPRIGRWLRRDPTAEIGGLNLYATVYNNPQAFSDPLGLALYAFDGTGMDDKDLLDRSNVLRLKNIYGGGMSNYEPGIGTTFGGHKILDFYELVTASNADRVLTNMHSAFLKAYNTDKKIDILGFSRGAALAREFANMISNKNHNNFKGFFGCPVQIRFIGLYDTVNQFMMGDYEMKLPHRKIGMAVHLVAKDEKRSAFPVTLIDATHENHHQEGLRGDHSDIGGAHNSTTNLLSYISLRKMYDYMKQAGINMKPIPNTDIQLANESNDSHDMSYNFWPPYVLTPNVDRTKGEGVIGDVGDLFHEEPSLFPNTWPTIN